MRKIGKSSILKLLESMENVVKKLPEDVRIGRLFLVDDGQGIILESGIQAAAEELGKTVEATPIFNENWEFLRFSVGTLTICQINQKRQHAPNVDTDANKNNRSGSVPDDIKDELGYLP